MKTSLFLLLAALCGASAVRAQTTRAELVSYVETCEAILQEFQNQPSREVWQKAKGVLILTGFLAGRYALDSAMSLYASLVFEQSYGGVDGDNALLSP